jgi:hypothetical protein
MTTPRSLSPAYNEEQMIRQGLEVAGKKIEGELPVMSKDCSTDHR